MFFLQKKSFSDQISSPEFFHIFSGQSQKCLTLSKKSKNINFFAHFPHPKLIYKSPTVQLAFLSFSRSNKNSHVVRHTEFLCQAIFFDFSTNSLILTCVANSHEKSADTEITTRCDVIFLVTTTQNSHQKLTRAKENSHTSACINTLLPSLSLFRGLETMIKRAGRGAQKRRKREEN